MVKRKSLKKIIEVVKVNENGFGRRTNPEIHQEIKWTIVQINNQQWVKWLRHIIGAVPNAMINNRC